MATITDKKQYPGEQYLNELITNIEFAARAPVEVVRAMAAELQKRREADGAEPVAWVMADDLRDNAIVSTPAYPCLDDAKERTIGSLIALYAAPPVPVIQADVAQAIENLKQKLVECNRYNYCADAVKGVEDACRAAMLQSGNFRENKNSSTNNFREIAETSTNYPVIPSEVLSAILKVAKIRADFDDFDGDRRGIGDCLDEAEQELIVTINKYASQLAAEPIATNDVREQTAVPPVPVIQADVAQAIENLKQKLVECNRYNYCADAVKGVEYACHAAMLQAEPVSNSDELPLDYLQGHKDGLEWAAQLAEANHPQTGDWLYDDPIDLARAIRKGPDMPTVQGGNSPVTPDGWISCSERMPEMGERQCYVLAADFKNNYPPNIPNTQVGVYGDWFNDGNPTWDDGDGEDLYLKEVTHWMPLPEPPQEVNRG